MFKYTLKKGFTRDKKKVNIEKENNTFYLSNNKWSRLFSTIHAYIVLFTNTNVSKCHHVGPW